MKLEVSIQNWKHIDNKVVVEAVANVLSQLAEQPTFEQDCASVKSPCWQVDSYGVDGLEMKITLRK